MRPLNLQLKLFCHCGEASVIGVGTLLQLLEQPCSDQRCTQASPEFVLHLDAVESEATKSLEQAQGVEGKQVSESSWLVAYIAFRGNQERATMVLK